MSRVTSERCNHNPKRQRGIAQAGRWLSTPQKNPSLTLRVMKEALDQNKLASRMR